MKRVSMMLTKTVLAAVMITGGAFNSDIIHAAGNADQTADTPTIYINGVKESLSGFIMPSGTTLVPFRTFFDVLEVEAQFDNRNKTLTAQSGETTIKLQADSMYGYINNTKVELIQTPAIVNDMFYVNLRFIAEAYGATVSFKKQNLSIEITFPEPLLIDGVQVKALQQEYHMIMGGVVQQIHGNAYNQAIYNALMGNKGQKTEAPASYSWSHDIDTPGHYYKNAQYDFLGDNGKSIVRFDIYSLIYPDETLPQVLMHDVFNDEWYLFSDTANQSINQLIDTASNKGLVKIISNNVA